MDNPAELEKVISAFLSGYFWKIVGFTIALFIMNWIKDFVAKIIIRNNLMSNQIINEDKVVKIGEAEGRITKISLTHCRLESEESIYNVPIKSIMESQIVTIKKEKIHDESESVSSEEHKEENKNKEADKNG